MAEGSVERALDGVSRLLYSTGSKNPGQARLPTDPNRLDAVFAWGAQYARFCHELE